MGKIKHQFITPAECNCGGAHCNICDGGLAICKVCGLTEGALTTDCPGEKVSMENSDLIYAGKLDYREGEGWVPEKNPTNQMWDRYREGEYL